MFWHCQIIGLVKRCFNLPKLLILKTKTDPWWQNTENIEFQSQCYIFFLSTFLSTFLYVLYTCKAEFACIFTFSFTKCFKLHSGTVKRFVLTSAFGIFRNYWFWKQKHIRGDKTLNIYNSSPNVIYCLMQCTLFFVRM